jgi:hypothetical protein
MPIQDKAGEILSLFPGPVTLYPSLNKWVTAMLGCAALRLRHVDDPQQ